MHDIRGVDEQTSVLVGGNGWSGACWLSFLEPIEDPHIVYTAHQEPPPAVNAYPGEFNLDWDGSPYIRGRASKKRRCCSTRTPTTPKTSSAGYRHPDSWEGGAWITTSSGKGAVLFAGTISNGAKYWYGYCRLTIKPSNRPVLASHGDTLTGTREPPC